MSLAAYNRGRKVDMRTEIAKREYPSTRRGSTNVYTIKKWSDDTYSCNCPGWRFKQANKPRTCAHETWFMKGYYFLTFAEATRAAMRGEKWEKIETIDGRGFLVQFYVREALDVRPEMRTPDPLAARDYFPPTPKKATLDVLTVEEMRQAEQGRMITAIKMYRERTRADLVTAKRVIEDYLSKKGYRQPGPFVAREADLPKPKPFRPINPERARIAFDDEEV